VKALRKFTRKLRPIISMMTTSRTPPTLARSKSCDSRRTSGNARRQTEPTPMAFYISNEARSSVLGTRTLIRVMHANTMDSGS
jgi:hypothetical protein